MFDKLKAEYIEELKGELYLPFLYPRITATSPPEAGN
jgi:hypothetical protein